MSLPTDYPEIEPYASGHLDVGEGHGVYWERVGAVILATDRFAGGDFI